MFEPPVSTPMRRMHANAASRIRWYSRSVRVWAGATVIESPVWTPMASKFSIEQTTTALSAWSRITSSSNSFQPRTDRSMRISPTGLAARPWSATLRSVVGVVGEAGAAPAEDERRAHHDRVADVGRDGDRLVDPVGEAGAGHAEPDLGHGLLEPGPVLGGVDGVDAGADQLRRRARRGRPPRARPMARFSAVCPPRVGEERVGMLPFDDPRRPSPRRGARCTSRRRTRGRS